MNDIKIFGDRVLFEPVHEELGGSLFLPQNTPKQYELGRVVVVGDGRTLDKLGRPKQVDMLVSPGDIIWFQASAHMAQSNKLTLEGKPYMTIMQHDMLARITGLVVNIESFQILGKWVLLDTFEDKASESVVIVPETVQVDTRSLRYKVFQAGSLTSGLNVGQEVIISRRAAQLTTIGTKSLFYIDSDYIFGTVG